MIPGLRQILLNNTTVSSLLDGERIYTHRRWRDTPIPAVLLSVVSTTPTIHKGSGSNIDRVRVQVSIFTEDPGTADQLGSLIRLAFDRYSGMITVDTVDYSFDLILFDDEADDYDDSQKIYFKRQDYFVLNKIQ